MPWIDFRLPYRALQDNPPKGSAESLQTIIWERWARPHMGNRLRGRAYDGIFRGGYVDSQARGGFDAKKWKPQDGALLFCFYDANGLFALHSRACAHFTEVSFATMLAEDHFSSTMMREGWALEVPRDATTALNDCATPFMDLGGVLYMLSPGAKRGEPPTLLTDPRLPRWSFADLTAVERRAVTEAVENRRCACLLCEYYRPRVGKMIEKRAAKTARDASTAAKKPAQKKPAAKKPAEKKPVGKKPAEKKSAEKKPAGKKLAATKPAEKKLAAKRPAEKKPAAKKPAVRKPAATKRSAPSTR